MSKLGELAPDSRFRLPYTGRTGVVLYQGDSGTRVRYENATRKVKGKSTKTDQTFEFDAPGRAVIISNATEVEQL